LIIVKLAGGLGNQMFQYAFAKASSKRLSVEFALDLRDKTLNIHQGYELKRVFGLEAKIATNSDLNSLLGIGRFTTIRRIVKSFGFEKHLTANIIKEPSFNFSQNMLRGTDNKYYDGYWQSEKYFQMIVNTIKDDFTFKHPLSPINQEVAIQINKVNSVSLHVRRGDYVSNKMANAVHGVCSLDYYRDAINHIFRYVENPVFFVFSDDSAWVKNSLVLDAQSVCVDHNTGKESYNDMHLMSLCKHNIIANSSFSWWSAWLNKNENKIVIAPKNWFAQTKSIDDLIPKSWVTL
jgi:hypothetical protein